MEEVLKIAAQQAPSLVVLVLLVWMFIKSIEQISNDFVGYMTKRDERLQDIGASCHVVQEQATSAIKENTVVMGRAVEALTRMEHILDRK